MENNESKALFQPLNEAVWHMVNKLMPQGFMISPNASEAPSTFEGVKSYWEKHGHIKVWSGASDNTIFADPATNWAFRAWNDYCHATGNHDFSLRGETETALLQMDQLRQEYGITLEVQTMFEILYADIIGQKEFFEQHGEFPEDQVAFDRDYLKHHFNITL